MSIIPQSTKKSAINELPKPHQGCCVANCHNDSEINFLQVSINGRIRSGAFSDFGYIDRSNGNKHYVLRDGYTFVGWITRCGEHYLEDLKTCRKSASPELESESLSQEKLAKVKSGGLAQMIRGIV